MTAICSSLRQKILVQPFVLDRVPADPDAEAQPPAAEQIDRGGLLGDERGLPLGQDEDAGGEADSARLAGEVAQQDEDLVDRVIAGVVVAQIRPSGAPRPEDMVIDQDVVVAEPFGRLRPVADGDRVIADLAVRERDADAHDFPP
jgi:hypothetical protein